MELLVEGYGKINFHVYPADEYFECQGELLINSDKNKNMDFTILGGRQGAYLKETFAPYLSNIIKRMDRLIDTSFKKIQQGKSQQILDYQTDTADFLKEHDNLKKFFPEFTGQIEELENFLISNLYCKGGIISSGSKAKIDLDNAEKTFSLNLDFVPGKHIVFTENLITVQFNQHLEFVNLTTEG